MSDTGGLDLREQIARIDNLLAGTAKRTMPWQVAATVFAGGAALVAAGAALVKLTGG